MSSFVLGALFATLVQPRAVGAQSGVVGTTPKTNTQLVLNFLSMDDIASGGAKVVPDCVDVSMMAATRNVQGGRELVPTEGVVVLCERQ